MKTPIVLTNSRQLLKVSAKSPACRSPRRFAAVHGLLRGVVCVLALGLLCLSSAAAQAFQFDGSISRPVLDNYLSRSITFVDLLKDDLNQQRNKRGVDPHDNIRMLIHIGAKFVGRAVRVQGNEQDLPMVLKNAKPMAAAIHDADPDIILEAGEFEVITPQVETITIPASVLAEFEQPTTERKFRYDQMLFAPGEAPHHEGTDKAVPDITKLETRMWFYFLSVSYIDVGAEAIHFGQVSLIGKNDRGYHYYYDLLARVRAYAHHHARRHFVLCDAHEPNGGIVENGKLLFDFHSKPLRIVEVPGHPYQGTLEVGYADSLYQRSVGGMTPSGWACDHLPYIVEFDNFGSYVHDPGKPSTKPFIWGWDEITWFGLLPEAQRNMWLRSAYTWLKKNDPNGHLEMPGSRVMFPGKGIAGPRWFWANTHSAACPDGFNTEDTIRMIWAADGLPSKRSVPSSN